MQTLLKDIAVYGGPIITVLEVLLNTVGSTPGWEATVLGLLVAAGTAAISYVKNQQVAAAKAAAPK